jgi:hypothetical protein
VVLTGCVHLSGIARAFRKQTKKRRKAKREPSERFVNCRLSGRRYPDLPHHGAPVAPFSNAKIKRLQ